MALRLAALRGSRVIATGRSSSVIVGAGKFPRAETTVVGAASSVVSLPAPGVPGNVVLKGVRRLAAAARDRQAHAASQQLLVLGQLTIQPGQVLALGYSANTPEGFLGRVDAVTLLQGGDASLQTEPATLEEAGAQGDLDLSRFTQVGTAGSADWLTPDHAIRASVGSSAFNPALSKAIKCKDGASAFLSGSVSVSVTPALHATLSLIRGLTAASFSLTGSASASLTAQAAASAGCTLPSTALLKDPLHIATFAGDIGPIPVVVVLQGQLFADANLESSASVQSDIKASASITAGMQWKRGAPYGGFSGIFTAPTPSFHFDPPSVTASGTAQADVEPVLQMLLYGVAGPQLGVKTGLALRADTEKNPWWHLDAPVWVNASLTVPDLDLSSGTLTLYQHTFADIADATGPFNGTATVTITNPGPQTSTVGGATSVQIHAADSDASALTYTATGLPPGLSINSSNGLISGTPTTAGAFTVNLTVTAVTGPSATTSFTWTVTPAGGNGNGCPAGTPSSAGNWSVPIGDPSVSFWSGVVSPCGSTVLCTNESDASTGRYWDDLTVVGADGSTRWTLNPNPTDSFLPSCTGLFFDKADNLYIGGQATADGSNQLLTYNLGGRLRWAAPSSAGTVTYMGGGAHDAVSSIGSDGNAYFEASDGCPDYCAAAVEEFDPATGGSALTPIKLNSWPAGSSPSDSMGSYPAGLVIGGSGESGTGETRYYDYGGQQTGDYAPQDVPERLVVARGASSYAGTNGKMTQGYLADDLGSSGGCGGNVTTFHTAWEVHQTTPSGIAWSYVSPIGTQPCAQNANFQVLALPDGGAVALGDPNTGLVGLALTGFDTSGSARWTVDLRDATAGTDQAVQDLHVSEDGEVVAMIYGGHPCVDNPTVSCGFVKVQFYSGVTGQQTRSPIDWEGSSTHQQLSQGPWSYGFALGDGEIYAEYQSQDDPHLQTLEGIPEPGMQPDFYTAAQDP